MKYVHVRFNPAAANLGHVLVHGTLTSYVADICNPSTVAIRLSTWVLG